jgi:hypothetical protein
MAEVSKLVKSASATRIHGTAPQRLPPHDPAILHPGSSRPRRYRRGRRRYLPLKGRRELFACCPSGEKSASFSVSPTKQFYHCFGCGAHGSAISFLMEYSGLGFVDAVKELAASVGMEVPRTTSPPSTTAARALLTELMAQAPVSTRNNSSAAR